MTYEEYQQQKAALEAVLAFLDRQYIAEHSLPVGTRVWFKGKLGYVHAVRIDVNSEIRYIIVAAKTDGSMPEKGQRIGYGIALEELEIAQ